jgi:hypothetical protein
MEPITVNNIGKKFTRSKCIKKGERCKI